MESPHLRGSSALNPLQQEIERSFAGGHCFDHRSRRGGIQSTPSSERFRGCFGPPPHRRRRRRNGRNRSRRRPPPSPVYAAEVPLVSVSSVAGGIGSALLCPSHLTLSSTDLPRLQRCRRRESRSGGGGGDSAVGDPFDIFEGSAEGGLTFLAGGFADLCLTNLLVETSNINFLREYFDFLKSL